MMIRIGVTGSEGFIGYFVSREIQLQPQVFTLVPFHKDDFQDVTALDRFVAGCDVVVHLAAMNRHEDPEMIRKVNLDLVGLLVDSLNRIGTSPQVIFASSTQESQNNPYGVSKKEGREKLEAWSRKSGAALTTLIIPNVFGPFGKPFYNSVVATFCYQLTHDEQPEIKVDRDLELIYAGELATIITEVALSAEKETKTIRLQGQTYMRVSDLLKTLQFYRESYLGKGIIPGFGDGFEINLFNTFRSYLDFDRHYPFPIKKNTDARGDYMEAVRSLGKGQVSWSTTRPGITRGNHFHKKKIERFIVLSGQARISLRKTGTFRVISFDVSGEFPCFVDMPVWYTHNITNTGKDDLITLFWSNELYNPEEPDTYFEAV